MVTLICLICGHEVCPSDCSSLYWSTKPAAANELTVKLTFCGSNEKTDPCPLCEMTAVTLPDAGTSVIDGYPSRVHGSGPALATLKPRSIFPAAPELLSALTVSTTGGHNP